MSHAFRTLFVMFLLVSAVGVTSGCAPRKSTYASPEGIERPATSLSEEKDAGDRAGEALVAVLVVTGAIAMIALPILLILLL